VRTEKNLTFQGEKMIVVFDMDNTLVDELGATVRPGIVGLLEQLRKDGHTLVIWTSSRRERASEILAHHGLRRHFRACICREDYDPDDKGIPKDIRRIKGDILVDDDPDAVRYVRLVGRKGFQITPYRKNASVDKRELVSLYAAIGKPKARRGG
jgi:phosphoglycolate phosphatase-like HAD superfamily hydrolase